MIWEAAAVAVGGALGATARYGVGRLVADVPGPYATLAVNVLGSFALGLVVLVVFGGAGSTTALLVGTGVCGAFTTFSSFSVQTVSLWRAGDRAASALNAAGTLVLAGGAMLLASAVV